MCGITGWVAFDRDLTSEGRTLEAMTATLRRRGPDATGTWLDRHAALGHRRLAVIDLVGGVQPMTIDTAAGPVTITYSGEVYNFMELRDELCSRGHRFRTSSDTEVVLAGYVEWGDDVAHRLNGMFAFAVWDARTERLVMIRDRLGIKPLYFAPQPDGVVFGSEPKAIFANPLVDPVVDLEGFRQLIGYSLALPGVPWTGMAEVEPGEIVTVERAGIRSRRYWRLQPREHADDAPTTIERVRALLDDIVRRQLVADVPTGVLLSGGLDSTTLAALSAMVLDETEQRVRTFSVDFEGHERDFRPDSERPAADTPFVRTVVAALDADHTNVVLDHMAVADPVARQAVVHAYDAPPGFGDRDRSMLRLFTAVRTSSTVVLSGESADEVFGGYGWLHDPDVQRTPMFPWVAAGLGTYGLPPGALVPEVETSCAMPSWLADRYADAVAGIEQLDGADARDARMRVLTNLHLTQMLRVLLDRKDRLSMAVGLEIRVPYCDHRLVEYVYNVPWSIQSRDGREKSLLREAVLDAIPEPVASRVKSAYPTIRDPRYLPALRDEARLLLEDGRQGLFSLVNRAWLTDAVERDPATMSPQVRNSLEWILNLAAWLEVCRPAMRLA